MNSELKIPLAIQADVDEIREWASKKPFVKSVHIFGSHITGGKNPNDLVTFKSVGLKNNLGKKSRSPS